MMNLDTEKMNTLVNLFSYMSDEEQDNLIAYAANISQYDSKQDDSISLAKYLELLSAEDYPFELQAAISVYIQEKINPGCYVGRNNIEVIIHSSPTKSIEEVINELFPNADYITVKENAEMILKKL